MTSYLKPTVLRHIPKCLIKYRTRFPEIAFEPLYNLFVPLLQTTAIEPRHVVDALRDDFLDFLHSMTIIQLASPAECWSMFYIINWFSTRRSCQIDPTCKYRSLESTDIKRHRQNHINAKALQIQMHSCKKCKKQFRNKSNLKQHLNRKFPCDQTENDMINSSSDYSSTENNDPEVTWKPGKKISGWNLFFVSKYSIFLK